MKRLIALIALWLAWSSCAYGMERAFGYCERGGFSVTTQGLQSTTKVQRSFVSCTVTVYNAGTLTLATIYDDNALVPTPKANPYTSASDGFWFFYAAGGKYDVRFSNSDIPLAYTRGDYLLCDPFGPNQDSWCSNTSTFPHNLLSETHTDTVPYTPPEIGDLIRGNLNNVWERIGVAQVGEVLSLIDVGGGQPYPEWVWPSTLDTCTSTQLNGVEVGCEHEINFIEGTNISMTLTDDSDNERTNLTINSTGGTAPCTDITQVTNLYVATTGDDGTGDGTIGSPWLTVQHAIDEGIPGIVCGRYIIHLEDAGTYLGAVNLAGRIFAGGGTNYNSGDFHWPISVDLGGGTSDNTWPYSWVEIVGDSSATETYILQIAAHDVVAAGLAGVSVAGANLTLRGLTIRMAGYGVQASYGSFVNLAGVKFENNYVHILGTERSIIHIDNTGYVNDCVATADCYSVLMTNNNEGGVPFIGNDGIEVSDGAYLTDFDTSGNNTDPATNISFVAGTGGISLACLEMKSAFAYIRGDLYCEQGGIKELSSKAEILNYTFDGGGAGGGIALLDSQFTCGVFGGCVITIKNALVGVEFDGTSWIDPKPTFTSVTTEMQSDSAFGVQGHQQFLSIGTTVEVMNWSATPTFYADRQGNIKKMTLTDNVTSSTLTGALKAGQEITFWLCQPGGGGKTFAWPANVLGADTIGATASKCNVQRFFYDGTANWYALSPMVKDQ